MPTYILRCSPDTAEYLLWSTVVDAPPTTSEQPLLDTSKEPP